MLRLKTPTTAADLSSMPQARPISFVRSLLWVLLLALLGCGPTSCATTDNPPPVKRRTLVRQTPRKAPAPPESPQEPGPEEEKVNEDAQPNNASPPATRKLQKFEEDPTKPRLAYQEIINPQRVVPGSLSLGTASRGNLLRQATMPVEGAHHAILPMCRHRDTNYGTEEVISLLLHGADETAVSHPGPRLMIGNIAQEGGGDIRWSKSHNSGRDADIAFYVLHKGKPVDAPSLLNIKPDLTAKENKAYTFDVPRNWALTKALLSHKTVQVQWLFVARWLKKAMLDHARDISEPEDIIAKAEKVLWQPTDSRPHNDHLHLRIYCSEQDMLEGCINTGPTWAWVETFDTRRQERIEALCDGLLDPEEITRKEVLSFLQRINGHEASSCIAERSLFDGSPLIRMQALILLHQWRSDKTAVHQALTRLVRSPGAGILKDDPNFTLSEEEAGFADPARTFDVLRKSYQVMGSMASSRSVPLLRKALRSKRQLGREGSKQKHSEAAMAAQATQHIMDRALVPPLIEALGHESGRVRARAAVTLRRITNHTFSARWGRKMPKKLRAKFQKRWKNWWKKNKKKSRKRLLLQGFKKSRVKIKDLNSWRSVDKLVKAARKDNHTGYNAHRVLGQVLGRWQGTYQWSAKERHARWAKWWRKNKKRFKKKWPRGKP